MPHRLPELTDDDYRRDHPLQDLLDGRPSRAGVGWADGVVVLVDKVAPVTALQTAGGAGAAGR
ncbi:MAG TPA: hypothetical protein VGP36_12630 [Mycobacteriales bacterium]|nr:hypothetical protein [Mycobacteriales bacterium]